MSQIALYFRKFNLPIEKIQFSTREIYICYSMVGYNVHSQSEVSWRSKRYSLRWISKPLLIPGIINVWAIFKSLKKIQYTSFRRFFWFCLFLSSVNYAIEIASILLNNPFKNLVFSPLLQRGSFRSPEVKRWVIFMLEWLSVLPFFAERGISSLPQGFPPAAHDTFGIRVAVIKKGHYFRSNPFLRRERLLNLWFFKIHLIP